MKQNFPLIRFHLYHATPRIYKLPIIPVNVLDDDQEETEMKRHIEIVKDDEVAIDAIPLAIKPPMIVEYKIDKDGRMRYFKLIRADGSSKRLLMKLKDSEDEHQVYERIVRILRLHDILRVTYAQSLSSSDSLKSSAVLRSLQQY
ncbi:hypothetical protein Tco_0393522 [Tanacetum coccineum]